MKNDCSSEQRCSSLCSISPGSTDWPILDESTAYNKIWLDYIESLQNYIDGLGLINNAYAYLWNEPQEYEFFKL